MQTATAGSKDPAVVVFADEGCRLVLERDDLALVGARAGNADRRAIERCEKRRAGHLGAELVEQRLEPEVDPGGRRGVVMGGQEQLRLEQLDDRPGVLD